MVMVGMIFIYCLNLNLKFIKRFIKKHNYIMCQKFLPKINKGDKRVFIINGKDSWCNIKSSKKKFFFK